MAGLLARSRPIFEKGAPYLNRLFRLPEPDHREETLRSRRLLLLTVPSFFVFLQIGPVSAFLWNSQNYRNRCPLLLSVPSFCSCLQLGRVSAFFFNLEKYRNRRPLLLSVPSFCSVYESVVSPFSFYFRKLFELILVFGAIRQVSIFFGGASMNSMKIDAFSDPGRLRESPGDRPGAQHPRSS